MNPQSEGGTGMIPARYEGVLRQPNRGRKGYPEQTAEQIQTATLVSGGRNEYSPRTMRYANS